MTTRQQFVARNVTLPCEVPGCDRNRYNVSRYCKNHRALSVRNGDPTAKAKSAKDIESSLILIGRFFQKQSGHSSFPVASKILMDYINGHRFDSDLTEREVSRVAAAEVDPMAILARLAAVWALDVFDPRAFPSPRSHTFALAKCVLCAAPLATSKTTSGRTVYHAPSSTSLSEVGAWIRAVLGPWLMSIVSAVQAEAEVSSRMRSELSKPFDGHPVFTAPPTPKPPAGRAIRTDN